MPLVECVPNISDGRRTDVIERCAAAVRGTAGITLLDVSSDPEHDRTVLTFAGEAQAAGEAILALAREVVARIDLRGQSGVHPRIGALDVVPFVPLGNTPIAVCVELAARVGAELARRFDLPVYLYEEAARRPERRNLADIRRGQFEGLAAKMADPAWRPDFGPSAPHPSAGATVVGARGPLIAFNVTLATERLDVARAIAAAIRESSGGLPRVKALGVPLVDRRCVQVTVNLTDFRVTGLHQVFDAIAAGARVYGVEILGSEIVGLVPAAALTAVAAHHLRLDPFDDTRVLEHALGAPGGWLV